MLSNNPKIIDLGRENAIEKLSKIDNISLQEARHVISEMSFKQYLSLLEASSNITPPSGQTISPSSNSSIPTNGSATNRQAATNPAQVRNIWAGQGSPVEQGMTVGLQDPSGKSIPGEITQVDMSANGVKVKNPSTGQEEWHSNDSLQTFSDDSMPQQSQMAEDLARMRKLAGISEDASCGATSAGSVASSPAMVGHMKKRKEVDESPSLEHPVSGNKTVVGATGPQASSIGKLSANLAARNKKTASRTNNGFKK